MFTEDVGEGVVGGVGAAVVEIAERHAAGAAEAAAVEELAQARSIR